MSLESTLFDKPLFYWEHISKFATITEPYILKYCNQLDLTILFNRNLITKPLVHRLIDLVNWDGFKYPVTGEYMSSLGESIYLIQLIKHSPNTQDIISFHSSISLLSKNFLLKNRKSLDFKTIKKYRAFTYDELEEFKEELKINKKA